MSPLFSHLITEYHDFPAPWVLFRDISPLLADVAARTACLELFGPFIREKGIEAIAGVDARGFILGSMLAEKHGLPFIMIRKEGKLPEALVAKESYACEYSQATLTIRRDMLRGQRVLVVDDVLATGGTLKAALNLTKNNGASEVFGAVLVELLWLKWREKLSGYEIFSAIQYE